MSRKDQIIEAAIKILHQNDFREDFSMATIAKEVNIGKSTIYEYFQNKDELMKAALMHFINKNIEQVSIADKVDEMSFEELFKAQITRLLEAANNSRVMIEAMQPRFVEKLPEEAKVEMKEIMEGIRSKLQERFMLYFAKGVEEKILTKQLSFLDGYIFTSLIVGSIITFSDPRQQLSVEEATNKLYETIVILGNN